MDWCFNKQTKKKKKNELPINRDIAMKWESWTTFFPTIKAYDKCMHIEQMYAYKTHVYVLGCEYCRFIAGSTLVSRIIN